MLPELIHHPTPDWLMESGFMNDRLPIADILQGSVFYPASAMDGRPVKYLGGFSHSFVYADCNIAQDDLRRELDTFKGYRIYYSRSVAREELCFRSFQPILPERTDGDPRRQRVRGDFSPYAWWAVYDRRPEYDEAHGPERFSLLFVAGEGVAMFQSLYYSNHCAPSVITLIRCDAFTGNWTTFFDPTKIFTRSVMQNPYGTPDYIFCDDQHEPEPPWPWFSKLQHTIAVPYGRLRLWSRGPTESITS